MRKIITILLITASTFLYSQSMDLNHKKIHIVDSTMGLGISPTSRLHVFGNGTTSNLFNVTNDKDATKDSSIIIKANGRVILGDSSYYLLNEYVSDSRLTIIGGTPLRLLNNAPFGYTSLKWSAMTDEDTIADYAQIMGNVEKNTLGLHSGSLYFQTAKGGGLSTKMYIDSSGYVGIGTTTPATALHIKGAKGGLFENTASGIALDLKADNGTALRIISGDVIVNSIRFHSILTTLTDNSTYALPTGYSWKGEIDVDSSGYSLFTAQIRCDADGTPYLEGVSWKRWSSITYVEVGSTDGYLNITDGGSGMAITNKLGYTIDVTLRFRRKQ